MKIALLGYGKMGKAIEKIALQHGHTIHAIVDDESQWADQVQAVKESDVAIDFSMPSTAVGNIRRCFSLGTPVVVGTTGWYEHLDAIVQECSTCNGALFVASNFSIGMNIMFDLNRRLAKLMSQHPEYQVSIQETHHIHKLDAPSGTAITLANDMIASNPHFTDWQLRNEIWIDPDGKENADKSSRPCFQQAATTIPIDSERRGEVPGIHTVTYNSPIDTITLAHSAKSRDGLALGAILAAEYLQGKKGYHTMAQLLNA